MKRIWIFRFMAVAFAFCLLALLEAILLLLTVFYLLVTPVGLLRRLLGKDTLRLKGFAGDGIGSVYIHSVLNAQR